MRVSRMSYTRPVGAVGMRTFPPRLIVLPTKGFESRPGTMQLAWHIANHLRVGTFWRANPVGNHEVTRYAPFTGDLSRPAWGLRRWQVRARIERCEEHSIEPLESVEREWLWMSLHPRQSIGEPRCSTHVHDFPAE